MGRKRIALELKLGILFAIVGFLITFLFIAASISRSASSTAAIGYIFAPAQALRTSSFFFIFGACIGYIYKWYKSSDRKLNVIIIMLCLITTGLFAKGTIWLTKGLYLVTQVRHSALLNSNEIDNYLNNTKEPNKFILNAIVQNKNTSPNALDKIAHLSNPELHKGLWSRWPIMGKNTKGLAIMRLIARRQDVLPETLEYLALESKNPAVLGSVLRNEKISTETAQRLHAQRKDEDPGHSIETGLAYNPQTSPKILSELNQNADEYVKAGIAQNPNTPEEELRKLLTYQQWHVRRNLTMNPNVPTEILEELAKDKNGRVKSSAIRYLKKRVPDYVEKLLTSRELGRPHIQSIPEKILKAVSKKYWRFQVLQTKNTQGGINSTTRGDFNSDGHEDIALIMHDAKQWFPVVVLLKNEKPKKVVGIGIHPKWGPTQGPFMEYELITIKHGEYYSGSYMNNRKGSVFLVRHSSLNKIHGFFWVPQARRFQSFTAY